MTDIPWDEQASLVRLAAVGEAHVADGPLRELVRTFLDMPPERQQGLTLRVAGRGWEREYGEAAIRELAAQPGFADAPEPAPAHAGPASRA